MDTLLSIKVFCSVVETGSFAGAAERHALSPAMTSRHLMHLERSMRVRLLNRTTRQLSLTEAGTIYYNRCRSILDDLEDAELTLANLTDSPQGTLKLTVPSWFAGPCFAGTVIGFRRYCPGITLDINFTDRNVNIVEEGYDLALRVTREPPQSLIARRVGGMPYQILASPSYLENRGEPEHPADLAEHDFIACATYSAGPTEAVELKGAGETHYVKLTPSIYLNTPVVAMEAAESGLGLTIIPAFIAHEGVASGTLRVVLPEYTVPEPEMYALYASRRQLSPKVRTFIDFFVSRYTGKAIQG
jgi:Transcriptional regulator